MPSPSPPTAVLCKAAAIWLTLMLYPAGAQTNPPDNELPLFFESGFSPTGTFAVNRPFPPQTLPAARQGNFPITYSLTLDLRGTAQTLPDGLNFDPATRVLNGTPTTADTYILHYTATENTDSISLSFQLTISADTRPSFAAVVIAPQIYTPSLAIPALALPPATGGNGQLSYRLAIAGTASELPDGLEFDPQTRTLSGIPTRTGSYLYIYTATDADGESGSTSFAVRVEDTFNELDKQILEFYSHATNEALSESIAGWLGNMARGDKPQAQLGADQPYRQIPLTSAEPGGADPVQGKLWLYSDRKDTAALSNGWNWSGNVTKNQFGADVQFKRLATGLVFSSSRGGFGFRRLGVQQDRLLGYRMRMNTLMPWVGMGFRRMQFWVMAGTGSGAIESAINTGSAPESRKVDILLGAAGLQGLIVNSRTRVGIQLHISTVDLQLASQPGIAVPTRPGEAYSKLSSVRSQLSVQTLHTFRLPKDWGRLKAEWLLSGYLDDAGEQNGLTGTKSSAGLHYSRDTLSVGLGYSRIKLDRISGDDTQSGALAFVLQAAYSDRAVFFNLSLAPRAFGRGPAFSLTQSLAATEAPDRWRQLNAAAERSPVFGPSAALSSARFSYGFAASGPGSGTFTGYAETGLHRQQQRSHTLGSVWSTGSGLRFELKLRQLPAAGAQSPAGDRQVLLTGRLRF